MIAVFVPSLMGAGLLASVVLVVADAARRYLPGTAARRLRSRHRRTVALVAPLATALGREPPEVPGLRRTKRGRVTYLAVAVVALALAIYVAIGSTANYLREGGYVEGVLWLQVLSMAAAAVFVAISVASVLIAVHYEAPPRWIAPLIAATPLGALDLTSLRHPPRPRPLRRATRGWPGDAIAWFEHLLDTSRVLIALPTPGHGTSELQRLRARHDELEAADVSLLVVAPPDEQHELAAALSPAIVVCDVDGRLFGHLGREQPDRDRPRALLVEFDGRISWQGRGREGEPMPMASMWRAVERRPLAILTPSDVLGPVVSALIAAVFIGLGLLAFFADRTLLSWDEPIRDAIRSLDEDAGGSALRASTRLGGRELLAPLTVLVVAASWRRCRRFAITLLLALPTGAALELLLKALVDRPRPPFANGFSNSFPSGHVVAAVAFWGLIPPWVYLMTRRRSLWIVSSVVSLAIIVVVAASRVYVGAHWPSDTVAGGLVGALFLLAAEWAIHNPAPREHAVNCPLHPPRPVRELTPTTTAIEV